MADEVLDGASEGAAEVTDLRSTIRAAVEAQRTPEPEVPVEVAADAEPKELEAKAAKPAKSETEAERNERIRDDKGRFAEGKVEPVKETVQSAEPVKVEAPKEGETVLRPPPGWSPTAKVAFDKLPPEVQQAVAKREEEVNNGFAKFQEYKPLDQYMEMAKRGGTTLPQALERYVGIERQIEQDMIGGVAQIAQNKGIHPVALANQILARYGAAPSEGQAGTDQGHQTPNVDLTPITQELNALKSYVQQQQTATVQTELQRFASDPKHTFFENVKADMGNLLKLGIAEDLTDAYDKACWNNKEIRELLIKQQSPVVPSANAAEAVQKAKAAAKATGGAPSAGFTPNPGTAGASIRDTIRAAVNAQRGI